MDLLEKYGPSTETLSDSQLELLELEPGVSRAEVEAETQREQLPLPLKAVRKHPGRQQLPAAYPAGSMFAFDRLNCLLTSCERCWLIAL